MQKKQKKIAKLSNGNHDDPLMAGEDGDVERIAKELEAKYVSMRKIEWKRERTEDYK